MNEFNRALQWLIMQGSGYDGEEQVRECIRSISKGNSIDEVNNIDVVKDTVSIMLSDITYSALTEQCKTQYKRLAAFCGMDGDFE